MSRAYRISVMVLAVVVCGALTVLSQSAEPSRQPRVAANAKAVAKPVPKDAAAPVITSSLDVAALNVANGVKAGDWNQWFGSPLRNNTPDATGIPAEWNVGKWDKQGNWQPESSKNVKWVARLGSQSYGSPVVANGKIFLGTNNGGGHLKRYPDKIDLGVLLCLNEADGKFLWQHSSEKLPIGRVQDWPLEGICSTSLVEGDRLWFVTSRGEVVCLDTEGFYDNEDDGPVINDWARQFDLPKLDDPALDKVAPAAAALKDGKLTDDVRQAFEMVGITLPAKLTIKTEVEGQKWSFTAASGISERQYQLRMEGPKLSAYRILTPDDKDEADVVWRLDMRKELGISQHNMCSCSVTAVGDILFVITGNGVDDGHVNLPAPHAPSFVALDKNTGKVLWTDNSPGVNVLHGQWSSPSYVVIDDVPQAIFGGGDGWLYSFDPQGDGNGKSKLLWKFDCNPKESKYVLGGRADRNHIVGTPVIYNDLVYVAVGEDPDHGEGIGHLWCIDPRNKGGDVSAELAFNVKDLEHPIGHRRYQAVIKEEGEVARPNPNSAAVWHYHKFDANGDGKIDHIETMHRTLGSTAIKDDLLFITDFSGLFHCLDAKTGKPHWVHDTLSETWGTPLIVDGKVYIGNTNGDVLCFKLSDKKELLATNKMGGNPVYGTPIVANGTMYIETGNYLFAIQSTEK